MQTSFITNRPIVYTVVVIAIFIFVSLVLTIYDCCIQKRQRRVMNSAIKTNAIVHSLYPSNVCARLLEQEEDKLREAKAARKQKKGKRSKAFLNLDGCTPGTAYRQSNHSSLRSNAAPIANVSNETTVLFADIIG